MAKKKEEKNGSGRPSRLDDVNLDVVKFLVSKGMTDAEMAQVFQVTHRTWYNWKKKNADLLKTLKESKAEIDKKVEKSLWERANGYAVPDSHICTIKGKVVITPTMKHYPPDATSMIFWLKNRQPAKWREKNHLEISENLDEMTEAQIDAKILALQDKQENKKK